MSEILTLSIHLPVHTFLCGIKCPGKYVLLEVECGNQRAYCFRYIIGLVDREILVYQSSFDTDVIQMASMHQAFKVIFSLGSLTVLPCLWGATGPLPGEVWRCCRASVRACALTAWQRSRIRWRESDTD